MMRPQREEITKVATDREIEGDRRGQVTILGLIILALIRKILSKDPHLLQSPR